MIGVILVIGIMLLILGLSSGTDKRSHNMATVGLFITMIGLILMFIL